MPRVWVFLLCSLVACATIPPREERPGSKASASAWDLLSHQLPGTWTMAGKSPPFTVSYKVVSAGSALVESWGAGGPHETLTVFYPDGPRLLLTHYCAQGNQPTLRLVSTDGGALTFMYESATNLQPTQAFLVERTLRVTDATLEDTETYRGQDGKLEVTLYRFTRAPPPGSG